MTVNNILSGTMFAIFNKLKDKFKKNYRMEALPVLIDYSMYHDLVSGINSEVKDEIVQRIKEGKLYFTTVQEIEYPIDVNENNQLIIKGLPDNKITS
jgi:hypothetical protein